MTILIIVQICFVIGLSIVPFQSYFSKFRNKESFSSSLLFIESIITILLFFCFLFHGVTNFNKAEAFPAFGLITAISIIAYWFLKYAKPSNATLKTIMLILVGTLFWLSLLTAIKFLPIFILIAVPIFGLLVATPFYLLIITLSEIRYQYMHNTRFNPFLIIFLGSIPILILNFILYSFFGDSTVFFKMFSPFNHPIY